jgi:hypothetical protein
MMTLKTFTQFCMLARWQVFGNNVRIFYDYYMSENVNVIRKSFCGLVRLIHTCTIFSGHFVQS